MGTFTVGIPEDSKILSNSPQVATVQVYIQQTTAEEEEDLNWEFAGLLVPYATNSSAGSWVAVSDDGSRILYSAPNFATAAVPADADENGYRPTNGAVLLFYNGEQEAALEGQGCIDQDEAFGQTISMSDAAGGYGVAPQPVVAITRAGCWTNETYRQVTVWEGGGFHLDDSLITNLVVRDPNEDCVMGGTGTAATVSKNGKRIVVLAACLDQHTYQTRQAIYTFEKDEQSQHWVERVSINNDVVVIDSDLVQYHMSSFAFDDDAKTVVLTAAGGGPDVPGEGLVCYTWNETTVSWQESWRKVAYDDDEDNDFGSATAVALSGNGKRLAIIRTHENIPQLAVYNLPSA
jgi:hypothetical protein